MYLCNGSRDDLNPKSNPSGVPRGKRDGNEFIFVWVLIPRTFIITTNRCNALCNVRSSEDYIRFGPFGGHMLGCKYIIKYNILL